MTEPDLSEFTELLRPKRAPCPVANARAKLDAGEQQQLDAAIASDNADIPCKAIVAWAGKRGHKLTPQRVNNHRKGLCSCERDDD